jgi:hypothetical protein
MAVPLLIVGGFAFLSDEPPGLWTGALGAGVAARMTILALMAVTVVVAAIALRTLSFWVLAGGPARAATLRT